MRECRKRIHFTGAGGVGMAGLAHLALDLGCDVTGSDVADSRMLETLRDRGVRIWVGHAPELPGPPDLLVYSSAVPVNDPEREMAAKAGVRTIRRGDFLNQLALEFPVRVAVSGSHGKTSTCAMIAHILKECGFDPGYMVGGWVNGWERSASAGNGRILVSEVDESDGSQGGFPATLALVMNIDDDHSWGLGGTRALERCFLELCLPAQKVLAWRSETTERLFGGWRKSILWDEPLPGGIMPLPGWHNRMDGAMAVEACVLLGVKREEAIRALTSFSGVSRRMSVRAQSEDGSLVLVEDYAHHPAELAAAIDALREAYPEHRLLVVFQPHRMERVERYGARFAELLSKTDWCCVVEPFGAWRTDGRTADVEAAISSKVNPPCMHLPNETKVILDAVSNEWHVGKAVLAVVGAGDITKNIPELAKKCKSEGTLP